MTQSNSFAQTIAITGALSYTGKYATALLLNRGYQVRTLTHHVDRENCFGEQLKIFPYNFDRPRELTESLCGVSTLINTYWVRFPRGESTFEAAVKNTRTMIAAAKDAGVRRIVHVSIANPSIDSPLGYYRGKAELENAVMESGLSYAILRPTVIFGREDILINNIAWFARRFPMFAIPGDGRYRIRPVFVEDVARLLADAADGLQNAVIDAVGPETFTFEELVTLIARTMERRIHLIHVPTLAAYISTRISGWLVGDVVLTWQEYAGLMGNLLAPGGPSSGETRLSHWLADNREHLGKGYASEVARHYSKARGPN
jgi:uncharacterized protein YbjT (DUF2867 family)